MGQGGIIVIVNGTELPLRRTYIHSHQMDWDDKFPVTIDPFSVAEVYVEFHENFFITKEDDGGDVTYSVPDAHLIFHIHASFHKITVKTSINTGDKVTHSHDDLGWNHNGKMGFVVAGKNPNYFIHNSVSTESWMSTLLPLFGDRCLRDICIPGSHDAGMSEINSRTLGSNALNTKTQSLNIHDQLMRGCRYLDVRPIIGGGKYWTGHYTRIEKAGITTYQGARGQSIDHVIQDINKFTATHNELVILNLSHDLNTDQNNDSYRPFTKEEYQGLLELLSLSLNHLFYTSDDVTLLPLNKIINGHPAVIVFVHASDDFLGKGTSTDYTTKGYYQIFYEIFDFHRRNNGAMKTIPPEYLINCLLIMKDEPSKTEDLEHMMNGQLKNMRDFNESTHSLSFLAWTLTLSNLDSFIDSSVSFTSIEDLAKKANERVFDKILPQVTLRGRSFTRPNILYLDYYSCNSFAALVVAINLKILKG